jgi:hypothetical protein
MRQAAGETPGRSRTGLQANRRTRGGLLIVGLTLLGFVITERFDRSGHRARAIFGERFARQHNVVLTLFDGSDGAAIVRRPIVKSATIFTSTLRRGILRGRQIAAPALSVRTPIPVAATAAASAATPSKSSPAPTAPAIPVAAAISSAVTPAIISLRAIVADARRIVAGRVVAGCEILRRGSVRLRLTFVKVAAFRGLAFGAVIAFVVLGCAVKFFGWSVIVTVAMLFAWLVQRDRLFMDSPRGEGFTRQRLYESAARGRGNRRCGSVSVGMAVIVVFEIFENVTDVEECIAIQADVDESRLHARKNARYFSLVDAADKRELFFALNVDLD